MCHEVICDYCGEPAELVDSAIVYNGRSYGNIWYCVKDSAYVGVHKNDNKNRPLGRLANKELREWKVNAHLAFDRLWKEGYKDKKSRNRERSRCYSLLSKKMGLHKSKTHIGMFDVDQCMKVVIYCNQGLE